MFLTAGERSRRDDSRPSRPRCRRLVRARHTSGAVVCFASSFAPSRSAEAPAHDRHTPIAPVNQNCGVRAAASPGGLNGPPDSAREGGGGKARIRMVSAVAETIIANNILRFDGRTGR